MKKIFIICLTVISYNLYSQTEFDTSQESTEAVNINQNVTRINLYTLDFDGQKIPLNLVYSHKGVKIGEYNKAGGLGWKIEDLGYINRIINGCPDTKATKGWFNSATPNFTSQSQAGQICDGCQVPGEYTGIDLAPDYFSCTTVNGNNFDFVYKKAQNGILNPILLSNSDGYKINTIFSNFISEPEDSNTNPVFNIYDKYGNQYNFINGPNLYDYHSGGDYFNVRNNYYLESLKNANNTSQINIEYTPLVYELERKYFRIGQILYDGPGDDDDYDNNIVSWNQDGEDFYEVDYSRYIYKKIISDNAVIDFIYDFNSLVEINITDVNENYITGYSFHYSEIGNRELLLQIKKFNNTKTTSEIIYEFEYFMDYPNLDNVFENNHKNNDDYFGYYNGAYKTEPFPFAIRNANNSITPAGDFTPNINFAKQLSLKKIFNKYGGVTEFDYQLNRDLNPATAFGPSYWIYGGGILLSSKKIIPTIGKTKLTTYSYSKLRGFVIVEDHRLPIYFVRPGVSGKAYSTLPYFHEQNEISLQMDNWPNDVIMWDMHQQGSMFRKIAEENYDFETMSMISGVERTYTYGHEGLFIYPQLTDESYFSGGYSAEVKSVAYEYSYQNIDNVDSATHQTILTRTNGNLFYSITKMYTPIPINRVKLIQKSEYFYNNNDPINKTTNYNYTDIDRSLIRSITKSTSVGDNYETKYFYSTDLSLEPNTTDLITKNIVGIPLLEQSFKGTEKLAEQKTVFAKDLTTSNLLLPKYIYTKKEIDSSTNLFVKKFTFDLYDTDGSLLQFTPENGVPTSTIWGYNRLKPIAILQNLAYSTISSGIITNLQNKSDLDIDNCSLSSCTEEQLRVALNALRTSFPSAMITIYTYDPLIGKTSATDEKGDKIFYEYDDYNRIKALRDKDQNIITEKEYLYSTQN